MNNLQPISYNNLHEVKKIRIYGNTLGSLNDVIDTLISINNTYNIFLLFQLTIDNPQLVKNGYYPNLLSLIINYRKFLDYNDFDKILLPSDMLMVKSINFNSPGFWEFLGSLNPLNQLRQYLNDRHNRKKDKLLWEQEQVQKKLENDKLKLKNESIILQNESVALQNEKYSIENSFLKLDLVQKVYQIILEQDCSEVQLREFTNCCINILNDIDKNIDDERISEIKFMDE